MLLKRPSGLITLTVALAIAGAVSRTTVRSSAPAHRADLSADLTAHIALHPNAAARVIVHGAGDQIATLVARHHVPVLRWLRGGAVVLADSSTLEVLADDPAVDRLSRYVP